MSKLSPELGLLLLTMSNVHDQITSAGPRNAELLDILAKTDYAPAALKQQVAFMNDVQATLKQTNVRISELEQSVQKELKDHEKYRDSTMRRFAYKVGGKKERFEEKASKEEREYFDAVVAKKAAEDERLMLNNQLNQAHQVKQQIEGAAQTHRKAQEELNELYNSIFAGPTPEFPEEDSKEYPVYEAEKRRAYLQTKLSKGSQAGKLLQEAQHAINTCLNQMFDAKDYSTWDVFGGGLLADGLERNALSKAASSAAQVNMLCDHARRLDGHIPQLHTLQIAQENMLSDVVFDNIFSDLHFQDKIKKSITDIEQAAQFINQQYQLALQRQDGLTKEVAAAEQGLKTARDELQRVRQNTFEQVAASYVPSSF